MGYSSGEHVTILFETGIGGSGVLIFDTLTELQAELPSGSSTPVWVTSENSWYYWTSAADTTAPTLTVSPTVGTYDSTQSVSLIANESATIYYTVDGSTPTISSAVYSSPISVSASKTIKAIGKDATGNTSSVFSFSYVIDESAPDTTAPIVTASPVAGTFSSAQSVTLSANETATIYYTTDGTTPTTSSSVYSTPIAVSATTTIKYFGKDTAGNSSTVQTALYTIDSATYVTSGLTHHWDDLTSQVTATDDGTYIPTTGDFTLCAVFKHKDYMNIISMFNLGGVHQYRIWIEDFAGWRVTGSFFLSGSTVDVRSTTDPSTLPSDYIHAAIVRSGTSLKLYLNNVLQGTETLTGTMNTASSTTIKIADSASDVKAVYLYNRALNTSELTQNYTNL